MAEFAWTHVTQPLTTDGSAVNNVIRSLGGPARRAGIHTVVVGSDNRDYRFPDADLVTVNFTRYLNHEYLLRRQRLADALLGRLGLPRRYISRMYRPVGEALSGGAGPVIVHDGFYGAAALPVLRRHAPDRRLFLWAHNSLSRSYTQRELAALLSCAEAIICVSDALRSSIAASLGARLVADRLVTVLNGVDCEQFRPVAERAVGRLRILFVGMMTEFKGPHVLLEALEQLERRGVDFEATFLGSYTHATGLPASVYELSLHRRAAALGSKVAFRPFLPHDDVARVFQAHDVLVVPSQYDEPFGLVVLEGMACGLAVVATRRGGIPEVGRDAVQYVENSLSLSSVLARLAANDEERRWWGRVARRRAETLTWQQTFDAIRSVIDAAC
jgi:glycosyltransferase involved in cell wall biosynthesis